ncbi:MAG: UrcA family protein [Pseudomonadota bacterium]
MIKSLAAVSVLAVSLTCVAQAETQITVDVEYDAALLQSPAGAETVLSSIASQALVECKIVSRYGGTHRDEACELDVIHNAVKKIGASELADAYTGSEFFIEAPQTAVVLAQN